MTISVSDDLYKKLKDTWQSNKAQIVAKYDVTSLSGYARVHIERGIAQDTLQGRFEIIAKDENTITVRDYFKAKDFDIVIRKGKVYCESDQDSECDHVGYVLHDPEVIERAQQLGVKLRK